MATTSNHPPHTVYLRRNWSAEWEELPFLKCPRFSFACGPETQDAVLEWDYGRIMQQELNAWYNYLPLNATDAYVKVVVEDGHTWYGVIVEAEGPREGEHLYHGVRVLSGMQYFLCRGLEYLLQRTFIDTSVVQDADSDTGEKKVGRAIGFNLGAGLPSSGEREGNMCKTPGSNGAFVFASALDETSAKEWPAHSILDYLIKHHAPRSQGDTDVLGWFVNAPLVKQILSGYKPLLVTQDKSFFQILNELVDRRRLMSWQVFVSPDNEKPEIRIFTFNRDTINLPDANTIPPNRDQIAFWEFDEDNLTQQCIVATDNAAKFDVVIGKGAPPGAVFTAEMPGGGGNSLLDEDWKAEQLTAFRTAATIDAGAYAALADDTERRNANYVARTQQSVKKVFAYYRINPTTFDGKISGKAIWPRDKQHTDDCLPFWLPGLRFLDKLPLRLEHDYEHPKTITNAMKLKSRWEYLRPFAFIKDNESSKYFFVDHAGRGESLATHIESSGRLWSASLKMQDDAFGIIVEVSGEPQQVIAKNSFTPIDDIDAETVTPDADYNYLAATLFAECDGHVTVQWPPAINSASDTLKRLIIRLPDCRLDYIVPDTTIDIKNGEKVVSDGGFIRDDTEYMLNVVRSAFEWYSQTRQSISVTRNDLGFVDMLDTNGAGTSIQIGTLIRTIGSALNPAVINTVVTKVSCDLRAGNTSYLTQFAELDIA